MLILNKSLKSDSGRIIKLIVKRKKLSEERLKMYQEIKKN
jgi:hypothetical protein